MTVRTEAPARQEEPAKPGAAAATARNNGVSLLRRLAQRWLVLLLAVACWEVLARLAGSLFFPPPSQILVKMHDLWFSGPVSSAFLTERAFHNIAPSLARALSGWAVASILGVGVGVALGRHHRARQYVQPLMEFGRVLPPPALVPIFLVLFGIGTPMQVALIIFGVIWPVLLNTTDGARFVDRTYLETAQVFQVPARRRLLHIILPAAGPKIFAGLRISLSIALILMVISEMVGSLNGIGRELIAASRSFEYTAMWAAIVLLGIVGYLLNAALLAAENSVLAWHRGARGVDE